MNDGVKLTVLSDKLALPGFECEHGLSFVVEADMKLLFDTGASDLFLRNANKLGFDLDSIDTVVISHGHYDHGNGLQYLNSKRIVMHPNAFSNRISGRSGRNISIATKREYVGTKNSIIESREPLWLSQQIVFLGEIPRAIPFETECSTPFHFTDGTPDNVIDDSGIAIVTSKGLLVISGCAHSGICNIVEWSRKVCGLNNVYGVIGGFHLTECDKRLQQTIDYMKKIGVKIVLPSHCTGSEAIKEFKKHFEGEEVKTGMTFDF